MASMPTLPPFDPHGDRTSLSQRWETWIKRFEGAMVGFNITAPKRKRALLFHFGGEALHKVFDTLENTGDENDYVKAKDALQSHFVPKKNIIYETIMFRRLTQQSEENVAQFCTRLRQEADKCEFTDLDRELITQIITGCRSSSFRRRALERQLKLSELIELARSMDLSEERAGELEDSTAAVRRVSSHVPQTKYKNVNKGPPNRVTQKRRTYHPQRNATTAVTAIHTRGYAQQKERPAVNVTKSTILLQYVAAVSSPDNL